MKKPWIWLRIVSILYFIFFLLHTMGSLMGRDKFRDAQEEAVITALRGYRLDLMGTMRSHYDLYQGFNLFLSVSMLILAIVAWQLASASRTNARLVRPLIGTLCLAAIAFTILGVLYFFIAPTSFYALAAICLVIAWLGS